MTDIQKTLNRMWHSFFRFLYTAIGVYLIFLLLRYPSLSLQYALTGLDLWFEKMIPTLLPFMILSGILINMNLTEGFVRLLHPALHFLYGTSPNGSYTLLMGFLCGFPMGARIAGELCRTGRLSVKEGNRLLAFCNNIGPIYFLSFVAGTLSLKKLPAPVLVMYGIPLAYGLFVMRFSAVFDRLTKSVSQAFQSISDQTKIPQAEGLLDATDHAVLSGLTGIAKLGGYMVFFNLLNILFVPFAHLPETLLHAYYCILEITGGIARCGSSHPCLVLIMLPFGGFSCITQTYSMIRGTGLSIRAYVCHKLVQTALTALVYMLWQPF